ncbi:hypothetical protein ABIA38_008038 [Embleya sp. AB8]
MSLAEPWLGGPMPRWGMPISTLQVTCVLTG